MAISASRRVAIYACVSATSTEWDTEREVSHLRNWCGQNRHSLVGVYIDYDYDGAKPRPERMRLFSDIARKEVDMVLVWSLDQFNAKGAGATAVEILRLLQHGVVFRSFTEDHLCTDDDEARL